VPAGCHAIGLNLSPTKKIDYLNALMGLDLTASILQFRFSKAIPQMADKKSSRVIQKTRLLAIVANTGVQKTLLCTCHPGFRFPLFHF
jgi:hypothetical protein